MGTILELEVQGHSLLWVGGNQNPVKGGWKLLALTKLMEGPWPQSSWSQSLSFVV